MRRNESRFSARWFRTVGCSLMIAGTMAIGTPVSAWAEETGGENAADNGVPADQIFVPGTTVNGLGVSGMTPEQAAAHIGDFYTKEYVLTIREKGGKAEKITGTDIGLNVGISPEFLREILHAQNASGRAYGPNVDNRHRAELVSSYSEEALAGRIAGLDIMTGNGIVQTADAHVSGYEKGKAFDIVPEVRGNNVDQAKAEQLIRQAVEAGETEVDLESAGCYYVPQVTAVDEGLRKLCDTMNRCRNMQVVYRFGGTEAGADETASGGEEERKDDGNGGQEISDPGMTEILDSEEICSWLTGTADGQITTDREKMAAYVKMLAEKYDTSGTERTFVTAAGTEVKLTGPYGWKINQAEEMDALHALIQTGESAEREPIYARRAVKRVRKDAVGADAEWGATYVEIDLTGQHVYMIKDGAVVWDAPCVTGNLSKKYDTPAGIYSLTYKERDRVLRGEKQADGTYEYETPVSYWMPFNGGIGLHDANWRGSFGGEIYKTNGSHGCVNLPPEKAGALYELVEKGMAVICY